MQSLIRSLISCAFALLLTRGDVLGQVVVCPGEPILFELQDNYYGEKTWEYSADGITWGGVSITEGTAVSLTPQQAGWYRVVFHDTDCDTTYVSNTVQFQVRTVTEAQLVLGTTASQVRLGGSLVTSLSLYDELDDVTYWINGTAHAATAEWTTIPNPGVDFSLTGTAVDANGCNVASDTLWFTVIDPQLQIPLGDAIQVRLYGQVYAESGEAVQGATVSAGYGGQTTETDENGVFLFEQLDAFSTLGFITVEKPGYFTGSRSFVPTEGDNFVMVVLLEKTIAGTLSATSGGTVVADGMTVTLPPNGFVQGGVPYVGTVQVAVSHIDPEEDAFDLEMPGMLLGVMDGESFGMVSYGMVAVELLDGNGNAVELVSGSMAGLRFPVPPGQLGNAPAQIELWYFDEELGYWVQEGVATLVGNEYVGEVGHFSWWNVDVPEDLVRLNGRIQASNGDSPINLSGSQVTISGPGVGSRTTFTSASGHFSGHVPRNVPLTMSIRVKCNGYDFAEISGQSLGSLANDATLLPTIIPTGDGFTYVYGTVVDCDSLPVVSGYAWLGSNVVPLGAPQDSAQFLFVVSHACLPGIVMMDLLAVDMGPQPPVASPVIQVPIGDDILYSIGPPIVACDTMELWCMENAPAIPCEDADGNQYRVTQIGNQTWMAENLRTTRYANGDLLEHVPLGEWTWMATGGWCNYNDNALNDALYGKLYNHAAVTDPRGVCPSGWRVPAIADWTELEDHIGWENGGGMLKSTLGLWEQPNVGATNTTCFSGLPGGVRSYSFGMAQDGGLGTSGSWWRVDDPVFPFLLSNSTGMLVPVGEGPGGYGLSVRCIME